jgi:hypothetical protein
VLTRRAPRGDAPGERERGSALLLGALDRTGTVVVVVTCGERISFSMQV